MFKSTINTMILLSGVMLSLSASAITPEMQERFAEQYERALNAGIQSERHVKIDYDIDSLAPVENKNEAMIVIDQAMIDEAVRDGFTAADEERYVTLSL